MSCPEPGHPDGLAGLLSVVDLDDQAAIVRRHDVARLSMVMADRGMGRASCCRGMESWGPARSLNTAVAATNDTQRQHLYETLGLDNQYDPHERMIHAAPAPGS
jgi:hypothetical protein